MVAQALTTRVVAVPVGWHHICVDNLLGRTRCQRMCSMPPVIFHPRMICFPSVGAPP